MAKRIIPPDTAYRSPEQLVRDYQRARALRDEEAGLRMLVYGFVLPGANPWLHGFNQSPMTRRMPGYRMQALAELARIYDPQATISVLALRDWLMENVVPDGVEWLEMQPGTDTDPEQGRLPDGKQAQLDRVAEMEREREEAIPELARLQRTVFSDLHRSTWSEAAPEALLDALLDRCGVLLTRKTEKGDASSLSVEHVSSAECSFEWSPAGWCRAIFRAHALTREECEEWWEDGSGWTFPDGPKDETRTEMSTFLEAAYKLPGHKAWAYQVIQMGEVTECVRRTFKRPPFTVFGVSGAPGDPLTRSIGERLLPSARTLNDLTRITLEGAEWRATPTFKALRSGILGGLENNQLRPGAVLTVSGIDALEALEVPADVRLGDEKAEQIRIQMQEIGYDNDLPRQDQPQPRTKYEIQRQEARVRSEKGPMAVRVQKHMALPVVQQFVDALFDERMVHGREDAPGEYSAVELDDREVSIVWTSPVAQMQRRREVEGWFGWLRELNENMPPEDVRNIVEYGEFGRKTAEKQRIPEEFTREKKLADDLTLQTAQASAMGAGGGATAGPGNPQAATQRTGMERGIAAPPT